ncbi:hypothetical protein CC77DRAFT_63128 [Alternaria alternata]|uniref:Uncharacterized protein n=1 Tax=Alternaria alternata TaxID=5599 RepID=A0A177DL83_ALTAL|nr:hypothetical protein CC77DRAFT_63128 [Alternaria alternata]OAG20485.1 hypothetical protein CC77DRAFT_63128 [Alternaria alternata]
MEISVRALTPPQSDRHGLANMLIAIEMSAGGLGSYLAGLNASGLVPSLSYSYMACAKYRECGPALTNHCDRLSGWIVSNHNYRYDSSNDLRSRSRFDSTKLRPALFRSSSPHILITVFAGTAERWPYRTTNILCLLHSCLYLVSELFLRAMSFSRSSLCIRTSGSRE